MSNSRADGKAGKEENTDTDKEEKSDENTAENIEMILSNQYSLREKRMIMRILSLIESGVKSRKEIGAGLDAAGDGCTGYKLKKILENLRSLGLISFSRGPEGIILEKKGREFIKTREKS